MVEAEKVESPRPAVGPSSQGVEKTKWSLAETAVSPPSRAASTGTASETVVARVMSPVRSITLASPVPLAKTLTALDVPSEGRLIAALGPGSSKRDYDALGIPFDERWKRFEEVIATLRSLLEGKPLPERASYYRVPSGCRARASSSTRARHTSLDRELGLERRLAPGCACRRRLACIRVQHDARRIRRSS